MVSSRGYIVYTMIYFLFIIVNSFNIITFWRSARYLKECGRDPLSTMAKCYVMALFSMLPLPIIPMT